MNGELVFYTNPMSRGRIVRWMLEEVGIPYRTEFVDFGLPMKSPAYLDINPMGKVPAIRHGDVIVTECAAICAYLADAFPGAQLAPAPERRASYYRGMFFVAGPLEMAVSNRNLGFVTPADRHGMVGYGKFEDVMQTLEKAVSANPFIAGDEFSAADVFVGSHVGWGLQNGTIEDRPAFHDYWTRLKDRPALVRANEIDNAEIARKQAG